MGVMEVMPDHVRLFVKAEPAAPPDCRTTERTRITNPKQQKPRFFVQLLPKRLVIFNIAVARVVSRSAIENDMAEGSTDTTHMAMA